MNIEDGISVIFNLKQVAEDWRMMRYDTKLFGSTLEGLFIHQLCKVAKYGELIQQYPVGNYRIDCVIKSDRIIGLEMDGKEFHDAEKDKKRDKEILLNSDVDVIYRVRGTDVYNCVFNVFQILNELEPGLIDMGRLNIFVNEIFPMRFISVTDFSVLYVVEILKDEFHYLSENLYEEDETYKNKLEELKSRCTFDKDIVITFMGKLRSYRNV